jgi:hypothetical protein
MKRIVLTVIVILLIVFVLVGARLRKPPVVKETKPIRMCRGFTVIEATKGIDCNGDTINLIKKNGFFEVAATYDENNLRDALAVN